MTQSGVNLQSLLEQALEHHRAGRLPQAEQIYRQVLGVDARNFAALHMLGLLAHQAGPPAQRAVQLAPDHPQALNNLGSILTDLGRPEEALPLHQRAAQINPKLASAWVNLASAQQWAGMLDEAAASARTAIELEP